MFKRKKEGFTLIELVIVIAILALLMALAIPRYQQSHLTSQATTHNGNVRVLKNAALLYLTDHPEEEILSIEALKDYLEDGKLPKPARDLKGYEEFSVSVDNGQVVVTPGNIKVDNKTLVLDPES